MILNLDASLVSLAKSLNKSIYVVGGTVRNAILGFQGLTDIDLCGAFTTEELEPFLYSFGFNLIATYKTTGTLVFAKNDIKYEYTTLRKEEYAKGGNYKPISVEFVDDVFLDAKRRDFKCNAIYYDIKNAEILDPLDGVKDVQNKVLDTVIEPERVFRSDGLRLLRLARFAGELNFKPTLEVLSAMEKYSDNILDIKSERIFDEIKKILVADEKYPFSDKNGHYTALKILSETKVLDKIIPELTLGRNMEQRKDYHSYDVLEHTLRCVLYARRDVRLSALLHDVAKPRCKIDTGEYYKHDIVGKDLAKKVLQRLKADNKTIEEVVFLVGAHMLDMNSDMRVNKLKLFIVKNYQYVDKLLALKQADYMALRDYVDTCPTVIKWQNIIAEMKSINTPFFIKDLAISGKDLIKLGLKGKKIGETQKKLFELCVLNPELNRKEKLLSLLSSKGLKFDKTKKKSKIKGSKIRSK